MLNPEMDLPPPEKTDLKTPSLTYPRIMFNSMKKLTAWNDW